MDHYDPQFASYNVATLNYSSSIVSPYEFHEQSAEDMSVFQFQLDAAFQHFTLKEFPDFTDPNFDWGMAAMDLVWKKRFSPFYDEHCGVGANGKMMNEQEFLNEWNKYYEKVRASVIEDGIQRAKIKGTKLTKQEITHSLEKQIALCRQFDLLGYRAFIKVFYNIDDIKNLDVSAEKYKTERKRHFSKVYLCENLKREKTINMIHSRNYDVFCLQECSKEFTHFLKAHLTTYLVIEMPDKLSKICDSVILLKKSKFPGYTVERIEQQRSKFLHQFSQMIRNPGNFSKKFSVESIGYLNERAEEHKDTDTESSVMKIHRELFWNNDTCYAVIGSLVVFSPHISTKLSMNASQINEIKKAIVKILTYFPEKHFICAGDLNGEFENQLNFETADKKYIKVNAFPYHNDDITCHKMRTLTQTQRSKAREISFCKKDYIITDLRINEQAVVMADGTQVTKANAPLIPNEVHPFDHFIVSASVRMIDRIESVSPLRRKKPVSSPFEGFNLDYAPDHNV